MVQFGISFFPAGKGSCLALGTTSLDHGYIPTGFVGVLVNGMSLRPKFFRAILFHLDAKFRYYVVGVHTSP